MGSSENHPMDGNVQVDEFVLEGYEQGKISVVIILEKKLLQLLSLMKKVK